MRKRDREALVIALLAFTAWQAYLARRAAEEAATLAANADDFDPTSWNDWRKAVRDVTVSNLIQRVGKMAIRRIKP